MICSYARPLDANYLKKGELEEDQILYDHPKVNIKEKKRSKRKLNLEKYAL